VNASVPDPENPENRPFREDLPHARPIAVPDLIPKGGFWTPERQLGAAMLAGEFGVTVGVPTARLVYQLLVDLDTAAQAVASWAEKAGATVGGITRSIENAARNGGLSFSQEQALLQALEESARTKSPLYADLTAIGSFLHKLGGVDVEWVIK
jgi:hypothetical protein